MAHSWTITDRRALYYDILTSISRDIIRGYRENGLAGRIELHPMFDAAVVKIEIHEIDDNPGFLTISWRTVGVGDWRSRPDPDRWEGSSVTLDQDVSDRELNEAVCGAVDFLFS